VHDYLDPYYLAPPDIPITVDVPEAILEAIRPDPTPKPLP